MKRVWQHGKFRVLRGAVWAVAGMLLLPASVWAAQSATGSGAAVPRASSAQWAKPVAGCRDGWRRVGTVKDPTLGRSWAVVSSCAHPAWPAHLEPTSRWKALPKWVPAGSRVTLTAPEGVTAMRLEGRTLTPGRVGQAVGVRLIDGARVRAKLLALDRAEMETAARWRWR